MRGDIVQDHKGGKFYRDLGDGTARDLSEAGERINTAPIVPFTAIRIPVVLVRLGEPTGGGDPLATRMAMAMHRRCTVACTSSNVDGFHDYVAGPATTQPGTCGLYESHPIHDAEVAANGAAIDALPTVTLGQ